MTYVGSSIALLSSNVSILATRLTRLLRMRQPLVHISCLDKRSLTRPNQFSKRSSMLTDVHHATCADTDILVRAERRRRWTPIPLRQQA